MSEPGTPPSKVLGGDHAELDALFEEFQRTPKSESGARLERFAHFEADLRHHIRLEENDLFPEFGEAGAANRALVERLLEEHRRIEGALDRLRGLLEAGREETEPAELELVDVLWEHNAREEGAVYPWFDDHLSPEKARALARDLSRPDHEGERR